MFAQFQTNSDEVLGTFAPKPTEYAANVTEPRAECVRDKSGCTCKVECKFIDLKPVRYLFYLDRKLIQEGEDPVIGSDALHSGGLLQAYVTYGNQELECAPLYVRKQVATN